MLRIHEPPGAFGIARVEGLGPGHGKAPAATLRAALARHGIELRGGRLLVPVWVSPGGGHDGHHPQQVATVYSDDGGATWHAGEMATRLGSPDHGEPVAVELSDGRVLLNMRNEDFRLGRVVRAVSTSPNGIGGWSPPRLDPALPDPISFGSLHRYDDRTLLFANVHNGPEVDYKLTVFGYRGAWVEDAGPGERRPSAGGDAGPPGQKTLRPVLPSQGPR